MKKFPVLLHFLAMLTLVIFVNACNKETDELTSEEDILGIRTLDLQEDDLLMAFAELQDEPLDAIDVEAMPPGRPEKCFSFNYPITIQFPDETTFTANNPGELRTAIRDWRAANPDVHQRPQLVYPVSLTMKDGTVVMVNNTLEMRQVIRDCARQWRHIRIWACLDLVYPVTIIFPDETTLLVNSKEELKNAIMTWRENNPDIAGRPHIQFPFDVQLKNGDIITVNDLDELKDLIKRCIKRKLFVRF